MTAMTAHGRWQQLDANRSGFLRNCELFASYTLPKICLATNYKQNNEVLTQDYQAVGAQAANHLTNKMMLALFAPSRPFFRLDATPSGAGKIMKAGVPETDLAMVLGKLEQGAVSLLDKRALRPKLFNAVKHLIITGNVMLAFDKLTMRTIGIRNYVVRRSVSGKVIEMMIRDRVLVDELDQDVQDYAQQELKNREDRKVCLYRWIKYTADGDYVMSQWVDNTKLPERFDGKWPEKDCPYKPLTWDLADEQDYGTGLVEDYSADFAGLSALSKAQIQGAILASEFRWLVNPAGMTKVEDFEGTPNGGAMPGSEGDIVLISNSKSTDLKVTMDMSAEYINRIGRAFLLGSVLVRDAERVTAEEIRMTANELETALGGGYSRIAVDFQTPLAAWLLQGVQVDTAEDFEPTIVTGLDALSRAGDLDELKLWLADMAAVNNLPEALQMELNMGELAKALAAPRRINVQTYLKSEEQKQAEATAREEQEARMMAAQAGADRAASAPMQGE